MKPKVNILIADDHPIFREGLARIIARDGALSLIAESGDGAEASRLISELKPDIAILDISMPTMSGLDIVRAARNKKLDVEFVILTMFNDEEYLHAAMELGVRGYILKDSVGTELLTGIRAVAQGKHHISPSISGSLIDNDTKHKALLIAYPALKRLTPSERAILRLLAQNKTSKKIAEELSVAVRTVENHRTNICRKLGFTGHNKLLQFALENKSSL